ncbi:spore germination protein GerW family protein [Streptomyces sp. NPDC046928]|uniref:GerW family sporulation protein n=1 Tax=Streptomyces sp. NPDC046928 TaxID=3155021 RepID=UPI0033E30496
MTDPQAPTPGPAPHPTVSLLERLAEKLGGRATVTAVYGEPVTAEGVTVVPVARVAFGLGGGTGHSVEGTKTNDGGGGGGGVEARPLGYIEIRDGVSTYKPIRDPWVMAAPVAGGLLLGAALPKLLRALRRHR